MVNYMKNIVFSDRQLTAEERDLFSAGYRNLTSTRRASWRVISSAEHEEEAKGNVARVAMVKTYRQKLENEIVVICQDVLDILDERLIPRATPGEFTVFYYQM